MQKKKKQKESSPPPAGGGYIRFMYRVALHPDYPETKGCLGHFPSLPVQEAMSL
jgi:hypothetical protein